MPALLRARRRQRVRARGRAPCCPPSRRSAGDPVRGRDLLLGGDYMTCGVPYKLWEPRQAISSPAASAARPTRRASPTGPGRNADMPYFLNVFTTPDGAEVVNANCLMCHGGMFDGQLVIGLGNATADFTAGAGGGATSVPLDRRAARRARPRRRREGAAPEDRRRAARVLGPLTHMRTVGMNPAELFAVILMVHHDRDTLAWSDTPLHAARRRATRTASRSPTRSSPPTRRRGGARTRRTRSSTTAWRAAITAARWRSPRRCASTTSSARAGGRRPVPGHPGLRRTRCARRRTRARSTRRWSAKGKAIFARDCAGCHGTYAARDEDETYPEPADPARRRSAPTRWSPMRASCTRRELVDWYNGSFYGGITRMVPNDPFPGYMPPPLDGIWATAPYLHNGSVPTVELVLNSRARPLRWRRVDLDSTQLRRGARSAGRGTAVDVPQDRGAARRSASSSTTRRTGASRTAGHPFGDHLTAAERRAVIEYLKTL